MIDWTVSGDMRYDMGMEHIGLDTDLKCANCKHHHCRRCPECHRCGCTEWKTLSRALFKLARNLGGAVEYRRETFSAFDLAERALDELDLRRHGFYVIKK